MRENFEGYHDIILTATKGVKRWRFAIRIGKAIRFRNVLLIAKPAPISVQEDVMQVCSILLAWSGGITQELSAHDMGGGGVSSTIGDNLCKVKISVAANRDKPGKHS